MIFEVRMDYWAFRKSELVYCGIPEQWRYYVEADTEWEARRKVKADRATRRQVFDNAQIESVAPYWLPLDLNDPRFIP